VLLVRPDPAEASLVAAPPQAPRYYLPQLDGLRFLAALLVFIHHAPPIPVLSAIKPYGWAGVDMFLAISAFLITNLILLENDVTGDLSLRSFFIRRALRIWPLYLTYATAVCLFAFLIGAVPGTSAAAWWLSHMSFSNNVMTAVMGYSQVPFSAHLWTISLEEQAYLVMPLLLGAFILAGRKNRDAILFCGAGLTILIVARLGLVLGKAPHPFIWVLPLRSDAFLFGALAAILTHGHERAPVRLLFPAGVLLVLTVPFFPPVEQPGAYQVAGYTVLAAGCASLVLACVFSTAAERVLGFAPVRYLGRISYGIYVYHLAAIFAAIKLLELLRISEPILGFGAALIITIAVASLSYHTLERPFLRLKARFAVVQSRSA
jgi:peptidoglycan/LPS O-acetylase OafA/YrhL